METFVVAFLAASVVCDLFTQGWAGIDLAAAWAEVGSYLPWLFAGWGGAWAALTLGEWAWAGFHRSGPADVGRAA